MAKTIQDLGVGAGFIYVKEISTGIILFSLPNEKESIRTVKSLGSQSIPIAEEILASGVINILADFTYVATNLDVQWVRVDSIDQIDAFAISSSKTKEEIAVLVANAINSKVPASGPDYTARATGAQVILTAPTGTGSSANGDTLASLFEVGGSPWGAPDWDNGNDKIDGGTESDAITDSGSGYEFHLDANYGSTEEVGGGVAIEGDITNALDITEFIVPKNVSGQTKLHSEAFTAASNKWTTAEKRNVSTWEWELDIDVSGELHNIDPTVYLENDKITIKAKDAARVITFKDKSLVSNGNIKLQGQQDFATGDSTRTITLVLINDPTDGLIWVEVTRNPSPVSTQAEFDDAGFNIGKPGLQETPVTLTGDTVDIEVGVDTEVIRVTGSGALTANWTMQGKSGTTSKKGDKFIILWQAAITLGGNSLTVFGEVLPETFTSKAGGALLVYYQTDGTPGTPTVHQFRAQGQAQTIDATEIVDASIVKAKMAANSIAASQLEADAVETAKIKDLNVTGAKIATGAVTPDKLDADITKDVVVFPVSFETGELGQYKIYMPYDGDVLNVTSVVNKAIEATDGATVQLANNVGNMGGGTFTHPAGALFGSGLQNPITSNSEFSTAVGSRIIYVTTSKTTPGGKTILMLEVQRK